MPMAAATTDRVNSSREPVLATCSSSRAAPAPDQQHRAIDEPAAGSRPGPATAAHRRDARRCPQHAGQRQQQDPAPAQRRVLDAASRPRRDRSSNRGCRAFQGLEQHHGAGAGQRQAEQQALATGPAPPAGDTDTQPGGQAPSAPPRRAGRSSSPPTRSMTRSAGRRRHQQHHADLQRHGVIMSATKPQGRRTDGDAGQQVAMAAASASRRGNPQISAYQSRRRAW